MSRLVRIAAAVLFLTVLVAQPERVEGHGGHYDCIYWGTYPPWDIYDCGWSSCQDIVSNWQWGSNCFAAACYESSGDDGETTILYVQCT